MSADRIVVGIITLFVFGFFFIIVICILCETVIPPCCNPDESNSPTSPNTSILELQHTSIQPNVFRSTCSEERRQRIEMFNPRSLYIQNWIRDTTQRRLTQTDTFSLRRATAEAKQQTTRLPPSYDDVIRQSSITTLVEHQALLPPSYNDFIQRDNERDETSF